MFASRKGLETRDNINAWFVDGTFSVCPKLFTQDVREVWTTLVMIERGEPLLKRVRKATQDLQNLKKLCGEYVNGGKDIKTFINKPGRKVLWRNALQEKSPTLAFPDRGEKPYTSFPDHGEKPCKVV